MHCLIIHYYYFYYALLQAECCSDHLHCCPSGFTCDVAHSRCLRGSDVTSIPWSRKEEALPVEGSGVICPDQKSECPDGNTCCKLKSGGWGCCPFPHVSHLIYACK